MTVDRTRSAAQRLGTILAEKGYIADSQLRRALSHQMESGARLGDSLVKLGYVTDAQPAEALASQKRLTVVQLGEVLPDPVAVGLLTERFIRARQVMPVDFDRGALTLAMVNPLDVVTLDDVQVMTGYEVRPVVATASGFAETVDLLFSHKGALSAGTIQSDEPGSAKVAEDRRRAENTSVVTLVNDILDTALKRRASDIHFEPQLYEMALRIRVDGVPHPLTDITNDLKGGVTSTDDLRVAARVNGMTTRQEDGLRKMMRMQTTLSEIRLVTV